MENKNCQPKYAWLIIHATQLIQIGYFVALRVQIVLQAKQFKLYPTKPHLAILTKPVPTDCMEWLARSGLTKVFTPGVEIFDKLPLCLIIYEKYDLYATYVGGFDWIKCLRRGIFENRNDIIKLPHLCRRWGETINNCIMCVPRINQTEIACWGPAIHQGQPCTMLPARTWIPLPDTSHVAFLMYMRFLGWLLRWCIKVSM